MGSQKQTCITEHANAKKSELFAHWVRLHLVKARGLWGKRYVSQVSALCF